MLALNQEATRVVERIVSEPDRYRLQVDPIEGGGRVVDCGIAVPGGLHLGLALAEAAMAGLGRISLLFDVIDQRPLPMVQVSTDHPTASCLASQYAGWQIQDEPSSFFAMGSGPMRAAWGSEELFDRIGFRENATRVVGILEGRQIPGPSVIGMIAERCQVAPQDVDLLIAPTASLAGGVQVVARSIETALHKLDELRFDLNRIVSGHGIAPLPPVGRDDLEAIGRTNDAILYGAQVTLYVSGDDESLAEIGPRVPSLSSSDYGEPFATIFARYDHDFYKVDPNLFSPSTLVFQNLETGRVQTFGHTADDVLGRSFFR